MISKMKFINIVGPRGEFERIVSDYVMDSAIEFENPLVALKSTAGFVPNTDGNPMEEILKRFMDVFQYAKIDDSKVRRHNENFSKEELYQFIDGFDSQIHALKERVDRLQEQIGHNQDIINTLRPIIGTELRIENLGNFSFLHYRFGKLPVSSYEKLGSYLKNLPTYFAVLTSDKDYVWGFYFATKVNTEKVDRVFATLYFERLWIEEGQEGTPAEIVENLTRRNEDYRREIAELDRQLQTMVNAQKDDLIRAYGDIKYHYDMYGIRKFASNSKSTFYLTGWIDADEVPALMEKIKDDPSCTVIVDEPETVNHIKPPTKLKNWRIFKPFEEFVRMYGLPAYNEVDPTPFLAIVYTLLFGIMFGDVGHGCCLLLLGLAMMAMKKGGFLAKLLVPIGISSTIFGFVYGSFFGFEGEHAIIRPLWFTPFENSGTMMNTLIYSVIIGIAIIFICMVFNIVNGVKQKNWQKILFSQNGVAGMLFYGLVLYCALSSVSGNAHPMTAAIIMIVISLLLIFLQEPLGKLLARRKDWMPKEKGGFLVEAFFELFEIVLSFVTNTVSFLRVGAFALNHAGMMSVVVMFMLQLNPVGSVAITIFGNLLVLGLEGLIVGIQVLRLGFYEMFSRFYDGDGREFKPFPSSQS